MPEPRKGFLENFRIGFRRFVGREKAKRIFRRESGQLHKALAGVQKQISEAERTLLLVREAQVTRAKSRNGPRKPAVAEIIADGSGLFNNTTLEAAESERQRAEAFLADFELRVPQIEAELKILRRKQTELLGRIESLGEQNGWARQ